MTNKQADFVISRSGFIHNPSGTVIETSKCNCCGKNGKVTKTHRTEVRCDWGEQIGSSWECDTCLGLDQEQWEKISKCYIGDLRNSELGI